jgi:hypothetical protein
MGRLLGLVLMLLAVWAAAEIYTKGVDGAFGGILGSAFEAPADRSTPDRAQDAFQRAYNTSERRVDRVLERDPTD